VSNECQSRKKTFLKFNTFTRVVDLTRVDVRHGDLPLKNLCVLHSLVPQMGKDRKLMLRYGKVLGLVFCFN